MKFLALFLLVLLAALPAAAQDEPTCAVDVSAAQDLLTQAAAAEPEAALTLLAQARDAILAIEQSCAQAGIILLDQTFTAPENTFTVSYPHGWSVGTVTPSPTGGVVFFASTSDPDSLLQIAEPTLTGGTQAIHLLVGVRSAGETDALAAVLADFEELIRSMYTEVSTVEYYTLEGRNAARLSFRSAGFDGVIVAVDAGEGRFAVARGIAAPGKLEAVRAVAEAMVLSVE